MSIATIRTQQEEFEREHLSPFATLSAESAGRVVPEEPCPIRTAFQRDRDRIIHCKAFRRLKHKTQVFIDPEEDHYRTRLSHTLEVSQVARTIARALLLNEDLTEAISLGHDLGHTPFGHSGERALDEVYREFVPDTHFRHNEHSLRVVECLEKDGEGLNLTAEVLEGILHHSKGRGDVGQGMNSSITMEAKVVRISDRIAYINHDIDDAINAGVITEEDLPDDCVSILGRGPAKRIDTMVIDLVECSRGKPDISMSSSVSGAMDRLKDFMFDRVYCASGESPRFDELRRASRLVKELFRHYMEYPEHMTDRWDCRSDDVSIRARTVCDFVAGMTDQYAQRCYAQLFMPEGWRSGI